MAAVKTIIDSAGNTFRFGRRPPSVRGPRLSLKNYIMKGLPSPPASAEYSNKAAPALRQIYGNDIYGDCCIAALGHIEGVFTGNAGDLFVYSEGQIVKLYSEICGYIPGEPGTDQGCQLVDVMNYWKTTGAPDGNHKIAAWVAVDATNPEEYKTAMWLFESLYIGLDLPDAYISPFPSSQGFVWDVAGDPDPQNGHCICGIGYQSNGVNIATWGLDGLLTDAAIAKYVPTSAGGEMYTILSQDSINKAKQTVRSGFNFSQLLADIESIG